MKYTLEIIPGTRIALYQWTGPITLEDRRRNRKEVIEFCQKEGVRSVLIDGREQVSKTGTMETFSFGTELPEEVRGFRIALVHRPDDDSLPLIATVAANRGWTTKSFLNIDEARAWLEAMEEPPNKPDPGDGK